MVRPVVVDTDLDISLEAYSAQERSQLLAESLDLNIAVEVIVNDATG